MFLFQIIYQYNRHNVSNWVGDESQDGPNEFKGFKWRGGRKSETIGIWMWSKVFTHDFASGEKVAIILIDTQGLFEMGSEIHDWTTTFALSMLMSSVQCYNIMQNIQENDLQNLELFIHYGRLVHEQTNKKPFQKMVFIVRDWPFATETDYGWHGQKTVEEILAGGAHKTREQIYSSFEQVNAFLMPYPGPIIAQGENLTSLNQIDPKFIRYVKELVPGLFAPDNLVRKEINGQKIRARDFVPYLQSYVSVFNGNSLPEPLTVLQVSIHNIEKKYPL